MSDDKLKNLLRAIAKAEAKVEMDALEEELKDQ